MAYCAIQAPLCNGPVDSRLKPVGRQKKPRPAILRQSVEVLRYIGGTRRYQVRADFLFGEWVRICPVEITEKTNDLPHLPWRWWAKRFQYEVKSAVLIRDLDWACEVRSPDRALCTSCWPSLPRKTVCSSVVFSSSLPDKFRPILTEINAPVALRLILPINRLPKMPATLLTTGFNLESMPLTISVGATVFDPCGHHGTPQISHSLMQDIAAARCNDIVGVFEGRAELVRGTW